MTKRIFRWTFGLLLAESIRRPAMEIKMRRITQADRARRRGRPMKSARWMLVALVAGSSFTTHIVALPLTMPGVIAHRWRAYRKFKRLFGQSAGKAWVAQAPFWAYRRSFPGMKVRCRAGLRGRGCAADALVVSHGASTVIR